MPISGPISPNRIFMGADRFIIGGGTPATAVGGTVQLGYWAMDQSSGESLWGHVEIPDDWQTFATFVWTLTLGTTASNNIVVNGAIVSAVDGQTANVRIGGQYTVAIVGGTTNRVQRLALDTSLARPAIGSLIYVGLHRVANDAADNYAADIGFAGFELVRAS